MKKHLTVCAVVALYSATVFGAWPSSQVDQKNMPPVHSNSEIYLLAPEHCFEIYGDALLLQPTGGDLHYAAEAIPLPVPSPNWIIHDIGTDYHFGFDVGLRGIFHTTNSRLSLSWEHFHSSDSASKTLSSSNMIGPFFEIGPDASAYNKAHGRAKFHFDEVNLDYGLFINFGDRLMTNIFSGVSFARIAQTISSKFSNPNGAIIRTIKVPSTFLGAGPQVGLDFCYHIVKGFHFTGEVEAALLVGRQKNHTSFAAISPTIPAGTPNPNRQSTTVHKKTQVVPAFEGKLGLSYVFTYCKHNMVKLEAGYQAQVYINAIRSVDIGSEVVTPPVTPDTIGVYARTFEQHLSNFALAGPYFKLDLGF